VSLLFQITSNLKIIWRLTEKCPASG